MAAIIAGLGAQLSLDTTEFKKGIAETKNSLKEFKEALPEMLSIAAFAEMTREALNYANAVVETAKANEVATASVVELSKALVVNGGDAESTSQIYGKFSQNIERAVEGNDKLQISFNKVGVSLKDLASLSEQQLFEKTVSGLGRMTDAAERNGLAMQLLGKSMRGVDFVGLSHTIDENKGKFDSYARALEMAHELSLKLKESHENLMMVFTKAVIPSLSTLYEAYSKTSSAMQVFGSIVKWLAMSISSAFAMATAAIKDFLSTIKGVWDYLINITNLRFEKAGDAIKNMFKEWQENGEEYVNISKEILKANAEIDKPGKPQQQEQAHRTIIEGLSKQMLAAQQLSQIYEGQAKLRLKELKDKEDSLDLTKKEKEVQMAVSAAYIEQEKALAEIEKKISLVDKAHPQAGKLLGIYEEQKWAIISMMDKIRNETEKLVKDQQAKREEWMYGWNEAFNQFKENAMNAADAGRQSFNSIVSSMTSALENFVKTGKLNFGDLAKSIIADLIRIQMQLQISQLFSKMNFGNFLPMLTGAVPTGTSLATDIPLPGRADGGDLNMNQAAIVGERGPELFIPKTAGTVIPNNQIDGSVSNTTVNNYNINAIDTKSFEDRIFQSSRAVWAAGQYATKSLAVQTGRM